jgi:hypothetical protein
LILPERGCATPVFLSYAVNPLCIFLLVMGETPERSAKPERAYATELLILLCKLEGSATPLRELPRLMSGTAIPREVGNSAGGAATMRKRREARTKAREKFIVSRTLNRLTGAR